MKKLNLITLIMCVCLGAYAQVPAYQRSPWTTNTPGSINAFATNTTIRTNLHVTGPTDSKLFQINTTEFVFSNLNANLGPLGVFGQGKEYGTPANNFSGYVQPYNQGDGYTRIWNTGPFGIFFGTDNLTRMRLDSPGKLGIQTAPLVELHVNGSVIITNTTITSNLFVSMPLNGEAPGPLFNSPIGAFGCLMMATTNTITVGSANTYYTVTGFTHVHTNLFSVNPSAGYMTNHIAGMYRVTYYLSMISGNSDTVESELFTAETGNEEIVTFGSYDNPARVRTVSASGVIYLPALTPVCLKVNNRSGANNVVIWRGSLMLGTP